MSADDFSTVVRVAKRSRIARAARSAVDRLRTAAARSVAGTAVREARARIGDLAPVERVRLTGVLILTATITHAVLLQWSPSIVRPGAPRLLRYEIAAAGIVMIVMAGAIARAWAGSQLRQLLSRTAAASKVSNGDD